MCFGLDEICVLKHEGWLNLRGEFGLQADMQPGREVCCVIGGVWKMCLWFAASCSRFVNTLTFPHSLMLLAGHVNGERVTLRSGGKSWAPISLRSVDGGRE